MLGLFVTVAVAQAGAPPAVALFERPAPGAIARERLDLVLGATRLELEKVHLPVSLLAPAVKARLKGTEVEGCTKGLECLFGVGRVLGAEVVVSVEATEFEDDVAVSLEAVAPAAERRLARRSFVVKAKDLPAALTVDLAAFAQDVSKALQPSDAPVIAPPPLVVSDPLATPEPKVDFVPYPGSGPPRGAAYAATAGAVVSGGAAIGLWASAMTHDSRANAVEPGTANASPLSHAQAQERVDLANRNASLALATAGLSAALTATAIYLWTR